MIALPPSEAGAVQLSDAEALPAVPVTPVGAPGGEGAPGGVPTVTSSKSVVFAPSFQSWMRWRFVLRV